MEIITQSHKMFISMIFKVPVLFYFNYNYMNVF